jgi:hypothetical protein
MERASGTAGGRSAGALVHGWWRRASWLDRLRLCQAQAIGPVLAVECDEPLPCGTLLALTTARAGDETWARVVEVSPRGDGLFAMQLALLSEPPAAQDARAPAHARPAPPSARGEAVDHDARQDADAEARAERRAPRARAMAWRWPLSPSAARTLG